MERRRSSVIQHPEPEVKDNGVQKTLEMGFNIVLDIMIVSFMIQCCSAAWYSMLDSAHYHLVTQLGLAAICYKALFCCNVWLDNPKRERPISRTQINE